MPRLPWSDNWSICDDKAFFVSGNNNRLYTVDLKQKAYYCISAMKDYSFRKNPTCICIGEKVFSFPDFGNSIQVYHLDNGSITDIPIDRGEAERLSIYGVWCHDGILYGVSDTTAKIYGINIERETVETIICIDDNGEILQGCEANVCGEIVYVGTLNKNKIYAINFLTAEVCHYVIEGMVGGIKTLCCTPQGFYITGNRKEIINWKREGIVETITSFPKDFYVYPDWATSFSTRKDYETTEIATPLFDKSYLVKDCIWLLPAGAGNIVRYGIVDKTISLFHMPGEEDDLDEINNKPVDTCKKYLPEYFREGRYIGIYSIKTERIFEIDAVQSTVQVLDLKKAVSISETEVELRSLLQETGVVI